MQVRTIAGNQVKYGQHYIAEKHDAGKYKSGADDI
jgi:hypothetical protein